MLRGVPAVKKALSLALVLCLLLALLPASASAAAVVLSPQNLMVDGWTVDKIEEYLKGNTWGYKSTSCADQLALGVRAALDKEAAG